MEVGPQREQRWDPPQVPERRHLSAPLEESGGQDHRKGERHHIRPQDVAVVPGEDERHQHQCRSRRRQAGLSSDEAMDERRGDADEQRLGEDQRRAAAELMEEVDENLKSPLVIGALDAGGGEGEHVVARDLAVAGDPAAVGEMPPDVVGRDLERRRGGDEEEERVGGQPSTEHRGIISSRPHCGAKAPGREESRSLSGESRLTPRIARSRARSAGRSGSPAPDRAPPCRDATRRTRPPWLHRALPAGAG